MKKGSFKLYFATFLFTITLSSFTFAGDIQCPIAPPPPGHGENGGRVVIVQTNDVFNVIKDLLGLWIKF